MKFKCVSYPLTYIILNISGDRALASRQSKKCRQTHGGFWSKIRHYDVVSPLFQRREVFLASKSCVQKLFSAKFDFTGPSADMFEKGYSLCKIYLSKIPTVVTETVIV